MGATGQRGPQGTSGGTVRVENTLSDGILIATVVVDDGETETEYPIRVDQTSISGHIYDPENDSLVEGTIPEFTEVVHHEDSDPEDSSDDSYDEEVVTEVPLNEASGLRSHAEGIGVVAHNEAEHAQGKFNMSNENTIHSIGIGTADDRRANAVEVLANGNVYIAGIGGYNGTNISSSNVKSVQEVIANLITTISDLAYLTPEQIQTLFDANP